MLEVKVRSGSGAFRWRFVGTALVVSVITLGLFYGAWRGTDWAVDEFLFRNEAFAIRVLDIRTDGAGTLPREQLQVWSGVRPFDNLLAVDLARIKRDLELVPLIKSAAVERILPDTLRISVIERRPVARISGFQQAQDGSLLRCVFYLDEAGYVMLPVAGDNWEEPGRRGHALPIITGVAGTELRPGLPVQSRQIHAALRLVAAFTTSPLAGRVVLQTIDASSPQVLLAVTPEHAEVTLGVDRFDRQLKRWRLVHEYARRTGKRLATLDLSVPNNVPARWFDSNAPEARPAAVPQSIAPQPPSRKRHV